MKKIFSIILLCVYVYPLIAQQEKKSEVSSEIKELTQFHEVIYPMWHSGWAEKNIKLLVSLTPSIKKGYAAIKKAKLPGILRDKKTKWDEGIIKLTGAVDLYKKAAAKKDSAGILDAAEKLHSQYEDLVRIVKPMMPQIENFHQELYMLYHHYLPNYNYEKVKRSVTMLRARNESLFVSKLPEKLKAKEEEFTKAKIELDGAVYELFELTLVTDDRVKISKAVDAVHSKYQQLEKVFK